MKRNRLQAQARSLCIWIIILAAIIANRSFAQEVIRGPYLQTGTPGSVVIRWRTDIATNSNVTYGQAPNDLSMVVINSTLTTEHEIQLSELQPDAKYYYAVGTTSTQLAGGDSNHYFVTSPINGTQKSTRIWVLGDSGTKTGNAEAVRDAYYNFTGERHTDLWLMLGDNAYTNGEDIEYQEAVFDMYPEMLRKSVLWATRGNHDRGPKDASGAWTAGGTYYNIFTLPTAGEAGGLASGSEGYYSFDYANIHFICLESTSRDLRDAESPMWTWLEEDLSANDQDWTIAFWHHPPYSKGSHDSDDESTLTQMRERALPILEAAGVDLVLCGHSHSYERSFLIDRHYGLSATLTDTMKVDGGNGQEDGDGAYRKPTFGPTANEGAVYIVAGSSGKTDDSPLDHPIMITSMAVLGSVVLDVAGDKLDAKFIDDNGALQDYFTIVKGDTILDIQSGDGQTGLVNSTLPEPFVVKVRDNSNNAIAGVSVIFEITSGQGSLSPTEPQLTDSLGLASTLLTLSSEPGEVVVAARAENVTDVPQLFNTTAELLKLWPIASTEPTPSDTDDPAIWIHADKPERSVIIGTDKQAGIFVWDLQGNQLQNIAQGTKVNNVDLRRNVEWGGQKVDIVVANLRNQGKLAVFTVNPDYSDSEVLTQIAGPNSEGNDIQSDSYGICLYERQSDGALFVFERPKSSGEVRQYRLGPGPNGSGVTVTAIRDLNYAGGVAEGFVADDRLGYVYITEEDRGIHKYFADPDSSSNSFGLFATGDGTVSDREGLALYGCDDSTGYLVLSSQGNSTLKIYERQGNNRFVGTVLPLDDLGEPGLGTDGLDITSFGVSAALPYGFLVMHDQAGKRFHLYDWRPIALSLNLCVPQRPRIEVAPASFDFGEVLVDSTEVFGLLLRNSGESNLLIHGMTLTGNDVADFSIESDAGASTIVVGDSRVVDIAFTPISGGSKDAALEVRSDDPGRPTLQFAISGSGKSNVPVSVDARSEGRVPDRVTLKPNYPNPFNAETTIEYGLPELTEVHLIVYNIVGQPIRALVNDVEPPGFKRILWNGKDDEGLDASSGTYYVKLEAGEQRLIQRIILLR